MKLAAIVVLSIGMVHAHIAPTTQYFKDNSYGATTLRVGHGCASSPTKSITVTIPVSLMSVKPQAVPGWTVSIQTGPMDPPTVSHGKTVNTTVTSVTWTATTSLPDDQYQEFGLSFFIRPTADILSKLVGRQSEFVKGYRYVHLPVVQVCDVGQNSWTEVAFAGETEPSSPAPVLYVSDSKASTAQPQTGPATTDPTAIAGVVLGVLGLIFGLLGVGIGAALNSRLQKSHK